MENCVFEVDIPLNFTLCFMNLVILNEYHLILRTMNEIKETQEVMMHYRVVSSPPIKPALLFFFWCFYNILFLNKPLWGHSHKRLQNAQIAGWEAQLCFLLLPCLWVIGGCLQHAASVGCVPAGRGLQPGHSGAASAPEPSLAFPGQDGLLLSLSHRRNTAGMRGCSINKVPAAPGDLCWGNRTRMWL